MLKLHKTSDMFRSPYDHPQGVCQSLLKLHYVHCEHQRKKNENNLNISFTPQLEPEITQEYISLLVIICTMLPCVFVYLVWIGSLLTKIGKICLNIQITS